MAMALAADFDQDLPLIEALRAGDQSAFTELWRRHERWVRGVIYAVLNDASRVEDVAQQVWWTVWDRIDSLRDARRWKSWLYRLARNAAIDAGRDRTRERESKLRLAQEVDHAGGSASPEHSLEREERWGVLMNAVRGLPAIYREPFVLKHIEDWSYREIGEVLDLPVDTVETRLGRARRLLRDALEGKL